MFSGFIFDVEGMLMDSVPQHLRSLQDALERHGWRVPYQTLRLYSGLDGDQMLQLVVPEAAEPERKEILTLQGAIYERDYLAGVKAFEGVRDVFRILASRGGKIALATDCNGAPFRRYLELIRAGGFISGTACGDDVAHGKPDRRLVGVALSKLGISAAGAVMVGDTPYDAEAGIEAGTKAAGVLTGGFAAAALSQAGCFAVAKDLQALLFSLETGSAAPKDQLVMGTLLKFRSKRMAG
jgi:phosphoglycolate phosphatase-like HAD superfamily hydrolase